ncbi:MAG TPA: MFS transporter [Pseudolysinimonas sp.]|nr:MFS transporter [Pseudolysinimonas sp.]
MTQGRSQGRLLALAGIVLLALGMRTATSAFSPVFHEIDAELHLGSLVLGVVGALPLVGFAASGFLAPRIARRFGLEATLVGALIAIVVGQVGRALAGESVGVITGTMVTMLGIGIANVLMPPTVKRYFPDRVGLVSAIYLTLFGLGAASPAFFAVPLSDTMGWRPTLAAWAVTVAAAVIPWLVLARRPRVATGPIDIVVPEGSTAPHGIARSPIAWALVLTLFGSASAGYVVAGWLPSILRDVADVDPATAGVLTGITFAMTIPAALLVPIWATRPIPAVVTIMFGAVAGVVGWGGLLLAPGLNPLVWCVLVGLTGVNFPLALTQIAARARNPRVAARLSGFVQGVAYVATGLMVFLIGVLHTITGDWTEALVVIVVSGLLPLPAVPILRRPRDLA